MWAILKGEKKLLRKEKIEKRKEENQSADGFFDARKRQSRIIFVVKMDERQVKVQRTGISHQANQYFDARKRQSRKIFVEKKTIKADKVQRTVMSHQRNQYFGALHLVCVSNLNSTTINGAPHLKVVFENVHLDISPMTNDVFLFPLSFFL